MVAYFILPYYIPDDNYYCQRSIINSRNLLKIETTIQFIDFYKGIRKDLIERMKVDHDNFFLLEGPSMQGKSTLGKTVYNELMKNSKILPIYIALGPEDPKNIFKNYDKCSWTNFQLNVNKLEDKYDQIVFIIDNIQLLFKLEKTEILGEFRNMKNFKVQFIFISSANSIIGSLRSKKKIKFIRNKIFRLISGFYLRVKPMNLKISLQKNSSDYKDLVKALKLNEKETDIFLEHFSIHFYYINEWIKWTNHNLTEFISFQKDIRKNSIMEAFETQIELFQKIIQEKNITKWNLMKNETNFLKSVNLIFQDVRGMIEYYDNLSRISLDEIRKERKY